MRSERLTYLQPVLPAAYDEFDVNGKGKAWTATHPNTVMEAIAGRLQMIITGKSSTTKLLQSAALRLGRSSQQGNGTLYMIVKGSAMAKWQVIINDISLLWSLQETHRHEGSSIVSYVNQLFSLVRLVTTSP